MESFEREEKEVYRIIDQTSKVILHYAAILSIRMTYVNHRLSDRGVRVILCDILDGEKEYSLDVINTNVKTE